MQKVLVRGISIVLFTSLVLGGISFAASARPLAATSPTPGASASYSVLAGSTVTNTGATTANGDVGVSAGTAITGFPPGVVGPPGTLHSNDASAIAAQADNLVIFGALDQPCDMTFDEPTDLTAAFSEGIDPGVYCSDSSFSLSGNLTLNGSGVWIFKTASTLITSPGSSITGGDPCDVWWRIGSSATLDTTTSFRGNIFALTDITLNNGASLAGKALAQTGQVVLNSNTINSPICAALPTVTPTTEGPTNTPPPTGPTNTPSASGPTNTPVVPGLPGSGGAPIRNNDFPWGLATAGGFSVLALIFGIRAYRRKP